MMHGWENVFWLSSFDILSLFFFSFLFVLDPPRYTALVHTDDDLVVALVTS